MEEQGKIISTCDVDSNLALQMWTRGKTPRLSIFNKNKNSRKLIHIAWVEKRDRTLSINGKKPGESFSYVVKDFEPAIQKILTDYSAKTNFKIKFLKLVIDLEKALNRPEPVSSPSEFAMLSEEKRSSLWIADCSKDKNSGVFRAFFPVNNSEAALMNDEKLKITSISARGTEALMKTGVPEGLKRINPERWHNTVRVTAAAMILGFSYCGGDGTKTADYFWTAGEKPKNLNPNVTPMKVPEKKLSLHDPMLAKLGHKMSAFIRHFYYVDEVEISYSGDSEKEMHEAGFERSRRIDFNTGTIGDVPYRVTFYENHDEGITAFGCNPRMQTARHTGDMIIKIPTEIYKQALKNNTMGGAEDDFFTLTRLLWAKQYGEWYRNIKSYVKNFVGLIQQ
ncbi:MAG: hypothetical protein IJP69_01000 [Synergistaceae bacterium]|nr:hypothetical protein [Synergistaceae bacterium]